MKKNLKGISLIVLVITIIVMIIIAGAIILSLNSSNIVEKAKIATFKTNMQGYKLELQNYSLNKKLENIESEDTINFSMATGNVIKTYIPSMNDKDIDKFAIAYEELRYINKDNNFTDLEKTAFEEMNIKSIGEEFIFKIEVAPNNEKVVFPMLPQSFLEDIFDMKIGQEVPYNFEINYGDGSVDTITSVSKTNMVSHTYATSGTKTVSISGICPMFVSLEQGGAIGADPDSNNFTKIISIDSWGSMGAALIIFQNNPNISLLPKPIDSTFMNLMYTTFSECSNLKLANDFTLKNARNLEETTGIFAGTKIDQIPNGLFADCSNLIDVSYAFAICQSLTSIPNDIFTMANNPKLKIFDYAFNQCTSVTGTVPALWSIFAANKPTGESCFGLKSDMSGIMPADIPTNWKEWHH